VVVATVDPELGHRGQASFVIGKDTPGLRQGNKESKIGIRASHTAEVVLEAPGTLGGLAPLPDFGMVGFRDATVDGRPIGTFRWRRLSMASDSTVQADTSALARDAASFSITWRHE